VTVNQQKVCSSQREVTRRSVRPSSSRVVGAHRIDINDGEQQLINISSVLTSGWLVLVGRDQYDDRLRNTSLTVGVI